MADNTQNGKSSSTPKEKKVSDKDLNLVNANRGVWLVKVPKYIADRWESSPDNAEVGKLKISRRQGMKPNISFTLDDKVISARTNDAAKPIAISATNQKIPKEHKFVVSNVAAQTLGVFSHTAGDPDALVPVGDKLALEGRVVQRAECKPINDQTYMKLKREAILKAIEPTRQTKQLDKVVVNYKPIARHQADILYEQKKKQEGKKSRDDAEKVREILFALFEKHQYYNIKDLVKETRQPVTYLKEILKEVCNYNLKNPHKNMWELKPEYRHYKVEEEKKEENDSSSDDD